MWDRPGPASLPHSLLGSVHNTLLSGSVPLCWAEVCLSLCKPICHSQHTRHMKQRPLYQFLTFQSLYSSDYITAKLSRWRLSKGPKQPSLCDVDFLRVSHSLTSSWWPGSSLFFWPRKRSFNLGAWLYESFWVRNSWEVLWILYHRPRMGDELFPFLPSALRMRPSFQDWRWLVHRTIKAGRMGELEF